MVETKKEPSTFIEWLEERQAATGFNREQFAKEAKISYTTFVKIMSGKRRPTPAQVKALLDYFNLGKDSPEFNLVLRLAFESELNGRPQQ